jgi:hypothetical protein
MGSGVSHADLKVPVSLRNHELREIVGAAEVQLDDERLMKLVRQMEFHHRAAHMHPCPSLSSICRGLVEIATPKPAGFKVPTRRFGRTDIQMPIVTVGGMRVQQTWMPDHLPIGPTSIK